jgi:signal transduction histidine kinase
MILSQAAAILATPPGSLAYHLILAVTLALFYAVSHAQYGQTSLPRAGRWALAAGWLLALRLFFMSASALNWLLLVEGSEVLPPLGHFVDLAGLLLFAWAFLVPQSNQTSDRLLLAAVVLNVVALGAGLVGPRLGADDIGLTTPVLDQAWHGLALLTSAAVLLLLALRRPPQWGISMAGFLGLAGGYLGQLVLAPSFDPLAGYVRLANLVVYPLLAIGGARAMISTQAKELAERKPPVDTSRLAYTQTAEAHIAVSLASLSSAEDAASLARRAAHAVAETMRAEYCLLISIPDAKGDFSVATGYDLIREQHLAGAPLDEKRSPILASALEQSEVLVLSSRSRSPDVYTLQSLLGLDTTGPAMLVPIANEREVHGGLLLLSPFARRSWSEEQRAMAKEIGRHLADRFSQLKTRAPASGEAYDALLEAQERIRRLERDNMRLFEAMHEEGRLDTGSLEDPSVGIYEVQEAEETIAILEAEIERLKSDRDRPPELPTSEELEQLKDELQVALEEVVDARTRIQQLERELDEGEGGPALRGSELEAIAGIAQELRQPMSSVLGYTDLLLGESVGLLGAMQRKFLERVKGAVDRMGRLLNSLVQVTALEAGGFELMPAPVDLVKCVEGAVEEIGSDLRQRQLALRMDFPDEVPAVMGDEEAVSQILLHLLKNAISATPEASEISVSASVERTGEEDFLLLAVRDSGEGIRPEDLGRVFQRMRHPERLSIPGLGDAGIGLSLVKGLSEALNGRVWVESEVGVGSTFTVLLPLAIGAPAPSGGLDE